jgi:hypothetical protein
MIPQPFTLILPAMAAALASWIKDARLPAIWNYIIVAFAFVLAVVGCIFFGGGLTGHVGTDIGIIITECGAVFAALKPLMDQASGVLPSPLSGVARRQAARRATKEEAAAWAAATANVPLRASAAVMPPPPPSITGPLPPGSQPGISGTFNQPLRPRQFVEDAKPTVINLPTVQPPTKPPQP